MFLMTVKNFLPPEITSANVFLFLKRGMFNYLRTKNDPVE